MNLRRSSTLFSLLDLHFHPFLHSHSHLLQYRGIVKARLKWVKNRGLDHIIDKETDLKAACLLKDAIKRSSTGFITSQTISHRQKHLGLTIPVLRFLRRYPTLFHEFPHSRYPTLPCFKLTDTATLLDSQEQHIHHTHEADTVERLCKLLMMMKSRTIPFQSLHPLKWDLGLPDNLINTLIPKYPNLFKVEKTVNGASCLSLVEWKDEFAVSALQKMNENAESKNGYREFKRGRSVVAFPMQFPRGYGSQKKVKAWMDDFQKLPYISPYEDSTQFDPNSDLMEKRVVGVLHELLSLTIHKKTKRNYLGCLREELNLPQKFTRIFTRYPGIFYLSLKCKTMTITLKEGYQRGKLVDPHPLSCIREKYYYVMRTGVLYRGKGLNLIPNEDGVASDGEDEVEKENFEDEMEIDAECFDDFNSDMEEGSDED